MVTMGICYERHLKKYVGATREDYIRFSARTAQYVAISRMDRVVCEKYRVYTVAHLRYFDELFLNDMTMSLEAVIAATSSPYELAKMYVDFEACANGYYDKHSAIAEHFLVLRKRCFERWGDTNKICDVSRKWFSDVALPLDVSAMNISTITGFNVSEEDLIDFVCCYKPNSFRNKMEVLLLEVNLRFREIVGFNLKDYYARHLIWSCESIVRYEIYKKGVKHLDLFCEPI